MPSFDPKDWTYEFQQRGGHPILMADLWCQALYYHFPREINLPVDGLEYLITSENKGYYRKGQREAMLEKFKKRLDDSEYLEHIFRMTLSHVEALEDFMKEESERRSWGAFVDIVLKLIPWYFIPWYVTEFNYLSDRVIRGLEQYRREIEKVIDFNSAAMLLMFPDKEMEFQKEQAVFYKLVHKMKEDAKYFDTPEGMHAAGEYLREFGWMKTFIIVPEELLTEAELAENVKTALTEKSDETYMEQRKRRAQDEKVTAALESVIGGDTELLELATSARYLSWLLTYSVERSMRAFAAGIPWYKEIARRIGVPYAAWTNLTIDEVSRSLQEGRCVVSAEEMARRKEAYVFSFTSGNTELVSGNTAEGMIVTLNAANDAGTTKITEIRGKSASLGKVSGKVRIVLTAKESGIVGTGDILVCGMTSPDYVPAMKRAGAIVTNEGGLLCHAAIISRELGKPCVIATKIATRVLKDGDLVEVDADRGIVRKLT